jgi:hypothetical protein
MPSPEAERTLARLYGLIEHRTGHNIADYPDPVEALDRLLSHEAATGKIPRRGSNWFSEEDRIALYKRIYPGRLDVIEPQLIAKFLAVSANCRDGAEFSSLVAHALLIAHDQIADLQKRVLAHANITLPPQFLPK